jgi:hypothetical protein
MQHKHSKKYQMQCDQLPCDQTKSPDTNQPRSVFRFCRHLLPLWMQTFGIHLGSANDSLHLKHFEDGYRLCRIHQYRVVLPNSFTL